MGRKLVLTGTKLTDPAAPILPSVDAIESPGSLLLIDPTHPAQQWAAGVPATGAEVPNLLAATATKITGSAAVAPKLSIGTGWSAGAGLLERSGKGGLHAIPSPTLATLQTRARVDYPDAIKNYILNNPTHAFYFSAWTRITQVGAANSRMVYIVGAWSGPASNYLAYTRPDLAAPSGRAGTNTVGTKLQSNSSSAWTGTKPTTASAAAMTVYSSGENPLAYTDALVRQSGAAVLYRHYVEDLTVSGRSYAQVDALDSELFTTQVNTAGGRYYGDTFTNPTTVA